ncbi:hypothetical protein [Mycolicibacterium aubagnense]|jgi:hypothetical protein|uniref:Uncharacterized protein n=1 Tax=Mycolicibacterium aubagnense TaxID=319707 RepID=A0ABM7IN33_9MYCO|nr:hypothetical protein [Mycolicibacterium aubagnense]BBX88219.1 hypothetical protein MAUB_64200 [Mycolicibacterium aubagnense]
MTGTTRGRPSLGRRAAVTAKLPVTVRDVAAARAKEHGTDLSPFLSDVLCFHYGRPDLMRHLTQGLLDEHYPVSPLRTDALGPHQMIRVPQPVGDLIEDDFRDRNIDNRSTMLADIICLHLGFPGLIRALDMEVMPLAM